MTSAVNVRSQLIHSVIFIFISLCIQCDGQTDCGKVLDDEDFTKSDTVILLTEIAFQGCN